MTKFALAVAPLLLAAHANAQAPKHALDDRMAAFHQSIVAINEVVPNAGLTTYVADRFSQTEAYGLAKVVVGVEEGGSTIWADRAVDVRVDDLPGGVRATYRLGSTTVRATIRPLIGKREPGTWEGAALVTVATSPSRTVHLRIGGGALLSFQSPRAAWLQAKEVGGAGDTAEVADGLGYLASTAHPLAVAVRAPSAPVAEEGARQLGVTLPGGKGWVMLGFARDRARARTLAQAEPDAARRAADAYYRQLLRSRIETPDKTLDAAFRSAILTLDYNWLRPYGWNECIHHWYSLWHMQHSPAAEWLDQADRSRECILAHAERLMPNGAAPQLSPDGSVHRDFGGSNQFYAWQVRHYLRQTGDLDAARRLAPVLDRIIEQTWEENDPDHDELLKWGQQIGNQEDYVSTPHNGTTPSVEGIQMLHARAELARLLGDGATASRCDERAAEIAARLREEFWQPELGRYGFLRDPVDGIRPDGQYHTLIYPVIYDLLDPLDAWTSMRHLRDRLTGPDGEVYCSANFPWHAVGTWGMQAGVAQQPWAARGLAAVGLRNEAIRPLHAAAEWAMNADHRGSWPEISVESTPAYFSPPAGLYIQAVVETIFGLDLDRPARRLTVTPCFPDAWPSAGLTLPHFQASYRHRGTAYRYRVSSDEAYATRLVWRLPPGRVLRVEVNAAPLPFRVTPGVACITVTCDAPAARETTFAVTLSPAAPRLVYPRAIAVGEPISVKAEACRIVGIADPCGVLAAPTVATGGTAIAARVRGGLLRAYSGFGRLGTLTFSRRTFFAECMADGARFSLPVDMTVLPRIEAAPVGELALGPTGDAVATIRLRNHTGAAVRSTGLAIGGRRYPAAATALPRRDALLAVRVPRDEVALLSPGDNAAELRLAGGASLPVTVVADRVCAADAALSAWAARRMASIPLPEAALRPDITWREWRPWTAIGHWPWANARPILEALDAKTIEAPGLPMVRFGPLTRNIAPVAPHGGTPALAVPLGDRIYRKLYVLVAPMLDNHDPFTTAATIELRTTAGAVLARKLRFPGDLDWFWPQPTTGEFATFRPGRDRFALLDRPGADGDYAAGKPPAYPQPAFWATCRAVSTPSAVLNVVEIDLGRPTALGSLTVRAEGADAAIGVLSIVGEEATGHEALAGTSWMPPADLREPHQVFALNHAGEAEGWLLEGGFAVAPVPRLFSQPTLNSLAAAGERATGRAVSPPFTLDAPWLRMKLQGGRPTADTGAGALLLRLVAADSGEVLATLKPPGSHIAQDAAISVARWQGRRVRLELIDENTAESYAWIGVSSVVLAGK